MPEVVSESGTPEAILSAEEVSECLDTGITPTNARVLTARGRIRASHEALRAAVERLTAERDAARVEFNAWEEERDRADAEQERAEAAEARVAELTEALQNPVLGDVRDD